MNTTFVTSFVLLNASLAVSACAAPTEHTAAPDAEHTAVPRTFVHTLRSESVDETFRISVALPDEFLPGTGPMVDDSYPVI